MDIEREQYLVGRILDGEREQFAHLVEEYQDRLLTFVFRMVHNREDAEDLVQESFIRAFESLSSFRFQSRFSTWLYQIAYNRTLNSIRRHRTRRQAEGAVAADLLVEKHDGEFEKLELAQIIEKALSSIRDEFGAACICITARSGAIRKSPGSWGSPSIRSNSIYGAARS